MKSNPSRCCFVARQPHPLAQNLLRPVAFVLLMLASPLHIVAQSAPVAAAQTKEEPVALSPFIIQSERETGWSANDTLSATRTKQALKDVPVNIDAITSHFMEDLGLFSADETAGFVQDFVTFDNVRFGPIIGTTKEIGLKGNFFDGRAGVTLGVFDIDGENVRLTYNNLINLSAANLEDLMNPNHVLHGNPAYKFSAPGTASAARNYQSTENSKGADLTLVLRPTKQLQLRFTLARTKVLDTPDLASFRGYYNAAVARGNESPAVLTLAKQLLDSLDISGRPAGAQASPWSGSWVIDYNFARESWAPLRGVRVGVNGRYRDNYLLGTPRQPEHDWRHKPRGECLRDARPKNLGSAGPLPRRREKPHRSGERHGSQGRLHDAVERRQRLHLLLRDPAAVRLHDLGEILLVPPS